MSVEQVSAEELEEIELELQEEEEEETEIAGGAPAEDAEDPKVAAPAEGASPEPPVTAGAAAEQPAEAVEEAAEADDADNLGFVEDAGNLPMEDVYMAAFAEEEEYEEEEQNDPDAAVDAPADEAGWYAVAAEAEGAEDGADDALGDAFADGAAEGQGDAAEEEYEEEEEEEEEADGDDILFFEDATATETADTAAEKLAAEKKALQGAAMSDDEVCRPLSPTKAAQFCANCGLPGHDTTTCPFAHPEDIQLADMEESDSDDDLPTAHPLLARYVSQHTGALVPKNKKGLTGDKRYFGEDKPYKQCWVCGSQDHESNACKLKRCFFCGEQGHDSRECTSRSIICSHCRCKGHPPARCPTMESQKAVTFVNTHCMKCGQLGHPNCGLPPMLAGRLPVAVPQAEQAPTMPPVGGQSFAKSASKQPSSPDTDFNIGLDLPSPDTPGSPPPNPERFIVPKASVRGSTAKGSPMSKGFTSKAAPQRAAFSKGGPVLVKRLPISKSLPGAPPRPLTKAMPSSASANSSHSAPTAVKTASRGVMVKQQMSNGAIVGQRVVRTISKVPPMSKAPVQARAPVQGGVPTAKIAPRITAGMIKAGVPVAKIAPRITAGMSQAGLAVGKVAPKPSSASTAALAKLPPSSSLAAQAIIMKTTAKRPAPSQAPAPPPKKKKRKNRGW